MAQSSSLPWGYITNDTAVKTQEKLFLANSSPKRTRFTFWIRSKPINSSNVCKSHTAQSFYYHIFSGDPAGKKIRNLWWAVPIWLDSTWVHSRRSCPWSWFRNRCQDRELSTVLILTWLLEQRIVHCADSEMVVGTRNCPWCWFLSDERKTESFARPRHHLKGLVYFFKMRLILS